MRSIVWPQADIKANTKIYVQQVWFFQKLWKVYHFPDSLGKIKQVAHFFKIKIFTWVKEFTETIGIIASGSEYK